MVGVDKVGTVCRSVGVVLQEAVTRRRKAALKSLHLQIQLGAFVNIATAVDQNAAGGYRTVGGLVVSKAVRTNDGIQLT